MGLIYGNFNKEKMWNKYRTMTAIIDENNSNPATCVSYTDDAVGMIPGSEEWDSFFGHYPVMLLNGVEGKKLQRNNFNLHEDGTTADITTGAEGDVMICFPRRGLHMERDDRNGHKWVIVSMTDNPDDPAFEHYAHSRGNIVKNKLYAGAYLGSIINNKLWSLSGKGVTAQKLRSSFRTAARAKGAQAGTGTSGYDFLGFYQLTLTQAMYVLKYANLNIQQVIGVGHYQYSPPADSGGIENMGMDYGTTSTNKHIKLFGMEDWIGNGRHLIEGVYLISSTNRAVFTTTELFSDNPLGSSKGYLTNLGYHKNPKSIMGTSELGFFPREVGGSSSTYYCCGSGVGDDANSHGAMFDLSFNSSNSGIGDMWISEGDYFNVTRLMYL